MNRPVRIANGAIIDANYVESIDVTDTGKGDGSQHVVAYMHNGHRHILEQIPPGETARQATDRWAATLRTGPGDTHTRTNPMV